MKNAKLRRTFKQTGITTDGKTVIGGMFKMYDTLGLPLDVVFELCKENGFVIDWLDFYWDTKEGGWKDKTFYLRIGNALENVYGNVYKNKVFTTLKKLVILINKEINENRHSIKTN